MTEWEIQRGTGRCAVTGRAFAEGEAYYASLLESETGIERREYALDAWTGPPEGSFCHWRGRVPVKDRKKASIAIDNTVLLHLFQRLEDDASEVKQQFRFVLALLLMRKRLLRFEQTVHDGEREYWQMRLVGEQSLHQVINPRLLDEQVDRLSTQLTAILSGDADAVEFLERPEDEMSGAGPAPQTGAESPEAGTSPGAAVEASDAATLPAEEPAPQPSE
jgi:hypothetical protein